MASFLGYTKNDLEESVTEIDSTYQQQIARFLTMFEMPDCGTRSVPILHKAAQKAGFSSGVPRKKRTTYSLGLTGKSLDPLKQAHASASIIHSVFFSLLHSQILRTYLSLNKATMPKECQAWSYMRHNQSPSWLLIMCVDHNTYMYSDPRVRLYVPFLL